jgi:hypothetical protein
MPKWILKRWGGRQSLLEHANALVPEFPDNIVHAVPYLINLGFGAVDPIVEVFKFIGLELVIGSKSLLLQKLLENLFSFPLIQLTLFPAVGVLGVTR